MLLSLMVYVMTVSLLLALAAWAFERAVRVFAFPTRWIWAGAMAGSVAYLLTAILRPTASSLGTVVATPLAAGLVPVVGSLTPKACNRNSPDAIFGKYFCFCSALPWRNTVPAI